MSATRLVRKAAVVMVMAFTASLLAGCGPQEARVPAAPVLQDDGVYRVEVLMQSMRFNPDSITVPEGARLVIDLENVDGTPHDLVLSNDLLTEQLARGQKTTIEVGAVEGTIDGWCGIGTHRQQGMIMTITG